MKPNKKRLFVAIEFPIAVHHEIARIERDIKKLSACDGTFVDPSLVHATLQFIGEVESGEVNKIADVLHMVTMQPLHAHLGNLNFFAHDKSVKIIFVELICPQLKEVVKQIDTVLLPWCIPDEREFTGHVTILRVKKVYDFEALSEFIKNYPIQHIEFIINSFVLMESELTADGPRYKKIM